MTSKTVLVEDFVGLHLIESQIEEIKFLERKAFQRKKDSKNKKACGVRKWDYREKKV